MKYNQTHSVWGSKTVLVPYASSHVENYHTWMANSELRQLTDSEELSLDEEHQMQSTWAADEDKLTFIVLPRARVEEAIASTSDHKWSWYQNINMSLRIPIEESLFKLRWSDPGLMVGDVNLFLCRSDATNEKVGEVEVMIAEADSRGKGTGLRGCSSPHQIFCWAIEADIISSQDWEWESPEYISI